MKRPKFKDPTIRSWETVEERVITKDSGCILKGWLMKNGTIMITSFTVKVPSKNPSKSFQRQLQSMLDLQKLRPKKEIEPYRKTDRPLQELSTNPITLFGYKKPHEHKNQESSTNL